MSNVETDYAQTQYQRTEYQGSDDETDSEGEEGEGGGGEAGDELPVMIAGPLAYTAEDTGGLVAMAAWPSGETAEDVGRLLAMVAGPSGETTKDALQPLQKVARAPNLLVENSHPTLPAAVVEVLRGKWAGWKASMKDQRKKHWRALVQELCAMEIHKGMDKGEWGVRLKVISTKLRDSTNSLTTSGMSILDAQPRPGPQKRARDQGRRKMDLPIGDLRHL